MEARQYPCEFCDTDLPQEQKHVTLTRKRGGQWYIFEQVSAWVCPNCGHRYFDAEMLEIMDAQMQVTPQHARAVTAFAISLADQDFDEQHDPL
jgi:YgiT-type zinc finger domain-containing protein